VEGEKETIYEGELLIWIEYVRMMNYELQLRLYYAQMKELLIFLKSQL